MKIITYKNDLINYVDFITKVIRTDYIDGFAVPITKTKDDQIVVFDDNLGAGNFPTMELVQGSTIQTLQQASFFNLENLLNELSKVPNYNKRLILYVYPLLTPPLSDDTVLYVNNLNIEYINKIKSIIDLYPNMDISISASDTHLLQVIKQIIQDRLLGLVVNTESLNYLQVDYYTIKPAMLDEIIIKQELDRGSEIHILITNNDELAIAYEFFFNNPNSIKNEILEKLIFTTGYPEIFYNLFNE